MLRLSGDTVRALFERAGEMIAAGREKDWLGAALREIAQERSIRAVDIHGLPWAEIDFPGDLDRARKQVLPAIHQTDRRASRPMRLLRSVVLASISLLLVAACYQAWTKPRETVWDSIVAKGVPEVALSDGIQTRHWSRLDKEASATLSIEGPTVLRIDARPLLADPGATKAHFVLEVLVNGRAQSWSSLAIGPSLTWTHEGARVGKRARIEVELPPGAHEVTTTMSAADIDACLVRFAQLDSEP